MTGNGIGGVVPWVVAWRVPAGLPPGHHRDHLHHLHDATSDKEN